MQKLVLIFTIINESGSKREPAESINVEYSSGSKEKGV